MNRTSKQQVNLIRYTFILISVLLIGLGSNAAEIVVVDSICQIKDNASFELTKPDKTIQEISKKNILQNRMKDDLNFGISNEVLWIRITLKNQSSTDQLALEVRMSNLDKIIIYDSSNNGTYKPLYHVGESMRFEKRPVSNDANFLLPLTIPVNETRTYYLSISNDEPLIVPLFIGPEKNFKQLIDYRILFFGLYLGIMLAMALYNLFIFLSLRDSIYLVYVFYLITIFFAQSNLLGYSFQYFWPNSPEFANFMNYALPALVFILGLYFAQRFLKIGSNLPRLNFALNVLIVISFVTIGIYFIELKPIAYQLLQAVSGISAVLIIVISTILYRRKKREAGFYLLAWSLFLIGVFLYILRDAGVLPYGAITSYGIVVGSALETILLSFALADRINTLKREKESSQRDAIAQMLKNEELITNQNIELERNVGERTKELNQTIETLKETQDKLVEAEKMASLGQLTSGVAHEINNPINFVSSSIDPLRQDIDDIKHLLSKYQAIQDEPQEVWSERFEEIKKEAKRLDLPYTLSEIDELLKGISEGARRTSEIVKGLGSFSRSDKTTMEPNDINAGVDATISIIKTQLKGIQLNVDKEELPLVECHLGKINQVIMNTINNAIHAVEERHENPTDGLIEVKTYKDNDHVVVEVSDNGSGIDESIQKDLFNPFFTTKEVGKGTGLGLSISYGIVDQHHGTITFTSEHNKGTTFKIRIPIFHVERVQEEVEEEEESSSA